VLLSDRDLRAELDAGQLGVHPFDPGHVQPASIDVRLGNHFRVVDNHAATHLDPAVDASDLTRIAVRPDGTAFVLHPGEFVLATTLEIVTLGAALAARLEGKSSLGRLGLLVHSTAGFIDPGFTGSVTLELSNVASLPIRLWPGMKIGQLCVFRLSSPAERPYGTAGLGSRYQGQRGPAPSRAWWDWQTVEDRDA
jgi:dCTP deaminase